MAKRRRREHVRIERWVDKRRKGEGKGWNKEGDRMKD